MGFVLAGFAIAAGLVVTSMPPEPDLVIKPNRFGGRTELYVISPECTRHVVYKRNGKRIETFHGCEKE